MLPSSEKRKAKRKKEKELQKYALILSPTGHEKFLIKIGAERKIAFFDVEITLIDYDSIV